MHHVQLPAHSPEYSIYSIRDVVGLDTVRATNASYWLGSCIESAKKEI
jgi:hypothetical protein